MVIDVFEASTNHTIFEYIQITSEFGSTGQIETTFSQSLDHNRENVPDHDDNCPIVANID